MARHDKKDVKKEAPRTGSAGAALRTERVPAPASELASASIPASVSTVSPEPPIRDLRITDGGGIEVVPRKYLLVALGIVFVVALLWLIPWVSLGGYCRDKALGSYVYILGLAALVIMGLLLWKKPVVFWAILIVGGVAGWIYYVPSRPQKPPAERPAVVKKEREGKKLPPKEVTVVSSEWRPAAPWWEKGPPGTRFIEIYPGDAGVEVFYADGFKQTLFPGRENEYNMAPHAGPNAFRLRSLASGEHKVKIVYTVWE